MYYLHTYRNVSLRHYVISKTNSQYLLRTFIVPNTMLYIIGLMPTTLMLWEVQVKCYENLREISY